MAYFTEDPTNPNIVIAPNGTRMMREYVDPADIQPAAPTPQTAPAAPSPTAMTPTPPPAAAVAPGPATEPAVTPGGAPVSPAVKSVLDKVTAVTAPLVTVQRSTTTQKGIAPDVLDPVLASNTAAGESQAKAVEQAGADKSARAEQTAMSDATNAYGGYSTAESERQQATQRAEIARLNELATAGQKDPEIDPGRYIRSLSTGRQLGMILLGAINGAFKAVQGQTGNDVLDIIERNIDQDIASQKEAIASGRIRRGNLIAYFQGQGLREEAAVNAAKAQSWAMLTRLAEAEKARVNAPEAKEQAALLAGQLRAQTEQRNNELKLSLGADRSTVNTVQQAAPTGGASVQQLKDGRDKAFLEASGLTFDEFQKQREAYSEKALKNDDLLTKAQEVVTALGGNVKVVKDANGNVERYVVDGELDTPHFGANATRYETAVSNLQRADVMGMAREPSAKLQDDFAEATNMPFRDSQKKVRLQQILDLAVREREKLRGGYNTQVTKSVDSAKTPDRAVPGDWK